MGAFKGWMNTRKNLLFAKFQSLPGRYIRNFYPLDEFPGATAAYSVRKLAANYNGPCFQVRRSSDNTTQDIFFNGDSVNTSAILSFVAGGNGFISIWYDQSGNANDYYQNTLVSQPRIALAGVLEEVENRPAIYFDGSNDFLSLTNSLSAVSGYYAASITKRTALSTIGLAPFTSDPADVPGTPYSSIQFNDNNLYLSSSSATGVIALNNTLRLFINSGFNGTTPILFLNGHFYNTSNSTPVRRNIFTKMGNRATEFQLGFIQEAIYWPTLQTQHAKAIYQNQLSFFNRV